MYQRSMAYRLQVMVYASSLVVYRLQVAYLQWSMEKRMWVGLEVGAEGIGVRSVVLDVTGVPI